MRYELSGESIIIRRHRPDDKDLMYDALRESLDELIEWMSWCHPDLSRNETVERSESRDKAWNGREEYSFLIIDKRTGLFAGACGLNDISKTNNYANLGYWVRTSATGKGYATSAVRLLTSFGFEDAGFHRLEIIAAVDNKASQRVAEKAGAQREGILRNRLTIHGKLHDAVSYSLMPEDFKV